VVAVGSPVPSGHAPSQWPCHHHNRLVRPAAGRRSWVACFGCPGVILVPLSKGSRAQNAGNGLWGSSAQRPPFPVI
jgi:hypothetical protein